jgi:hypothetical protein
MTTSVGAEASTPTKIRYLFANIQIKSIVSVCKQRGDSEFVGMQLSLHFDSLLALAFEQ